MIATLLEIYIIDPLLWGNGFKKDATPKKSDKPASTILWAIITTGIALIVQLWIKDNWALSYVFLAFTFRVAIFDYLMNLSRIGKRRQPLFYLGNNFTDKIKKKIPVFARVFFELWFLVVGILQYLHFNGTIYQDSSIFGLPVFK